MQTHRRQPPPRRKAARIPIALAAWLALAGSAPAEEPPVTPAPPADARETALAERDAALQTFLNLTDEDRYEEAVTIARQIVDLTIRVHGEKSIELAAPLTNLATAQMRGGDLAGAEQNYRTSIAIIEAEEGVSSTAIINPLVGLGETYMRGGLYQQANVAYRRALQVNHASAGFYNVEQVKILDGLAESYLALDQLSQANAQQRIQVTIQRRRSGPDSPEIVPALYKLGRWYNRTGQYPQAHETYQNARRIISMSKGSKDPALVDALLGEAISYENEGAIPASTSAIKRALDILDSQPVPDHSKRAEVLVALGDLYTLARQPRAARQRYVDAWKELSGDEPLLQERDRYFARPSQISGPRLPNVIDGAGAAQKGPAPAGMFAKGYVVASLTVDTDGDALNMTIIESDPPGLMDKQLLSALEFMAFRPQMVDGAVVASEGLQFRHDFLYPQPAPAGQEAPPAPDSAGKKGERINYPDQPDEPGGPPER